MMKAPTRSVGDTPVEFEVALDRQLLGTLKISKRGASWLPFGSSEVYLPWDEFDAVMQAG